MSLSRSELETRLSIPQLSEYSHRHGTAFFAFSLPGEKSVAMWNSLRKSATTLGYWPVIFGEPKNLKDFAQMLDSDHAEAAAPTLEQAAALDVQEYFARREEELNDEHVHGEWPAHIQGNTEFSVPRNILKQEEFHRTVDLGLVPAQNSPEVPAYLNFGGWNDCPYPHEHVAVLRYWNHTYGAEIVCLSRDVIEMKVARRPSSREEALQLAREQYWYCYDIVEQGVATIENLAASLMASDIWYFWWD